mmetsp:Transcript_6031/g.11900  ORF Transcript_6031/g.11900 Transcript_6031/m.11900 type:complete len:203 (+) Transcript_6031:327-935(+)
MLSMCMALVGSRPEFSASVRGTTSKASANLRMPYWSRPLSSSAKALSRLASSSSTAPAPGRSRASLQRVLTACTPSSRARSTSLMKFSVLARTTMVATEVSSSSSWFRMVTFRPAISFTSMLEHSPISSGVQGPKRITAVAPRAPHSLRSSNLEVILSTMRSYLSKKCRAISLSEPLQITTLAPEAAMPSTISSIFFSSLLL